MHGLETIVQMNKRAIAEAQRLSDMAEVNYFMREPKARNRAEALAAWERLMGMKNETQ